ncbi:MAG: Gfo/Idh/MocA family oxidoreductase, partial [Candidatus Krumholzibacteria bacterium]|nr:Gfo/Idh/MocA family oxidoreductase [Candidatus Krumholzibacteria bacterium]
QLNGKSQFKMKETNRRDFLKAGVGAAAAFTVVPRHVLGGPGVTPPSEKLNLAVIGVGGKGFDNVRNFGDQNIVALCDVDDHLAADAFRMFPKAARYHDYRGMLDKEKSIDAVIVSTPNHTHIPISVMAMRLGKHVYCEKPLGNNVHEVRVAAQVAEETGAVTQMGNSAHSGMNYRGVARMIQEGIIGEVREVHCWCEKAWAPGDRPAPMAVPSHLDWNLWLGPAPERPYNRCYHPKAWRNWWDFGAGRLGDMGCHILDLPFQALNLKYPTTVSADGPRPAHPESAPPWMICKWTFPKRGDKPPVELTWYDGDKRTPMHKQYQIPVWPPEDLGTIFVGSEGILAAGYSRFKLYPEEKYKGVRLAKVPRLHSHYMEWTEACKTDDPKRPGTHFGYSGPLTETVLLGTVAFRAGNKLEWNAENLDITNDPEANRFIRRTNRKGWEIEGGMI